MIDIHGKTETGRYAATYWTVSDVIDYRQSNDMSEWTEQEAAEWLTANAKYIKEAMVKAGYDAMGELM